MTSSASTYLLIEDLNLREDILLHIMHIPTYICELLEIELIPKSLDLGDLWKRALEFVQ